MYKRRINQSIVFERAFFFYINRQRRSVNTTRARKHFGAIKKKNPRNKVTSLVNIFGRSFKPIRINRRYSQVARDTNEHH